MSEIVTHEKSLIHLTESDQGWTEYPEKDEFLKFISPYNGKDLVPEDMTVMLQALPFYDEVNLIRISMSKDMEWGFAFFLEYGYDHVQLAGSFAPIGELNETGVLNLNNETVYDYLKFVAFFWNDDAGFNACVVEGRGSEYLVKRSAYDQSRFLRKYDGVKIERFEKPDHYIVNTRVWSGDGVHDANYRVNFDGKLERRKLVFVNNV